MAEKFTEVDYYNAAVFQVALGKNPYEELGRAVIRYEKNPDDCNIKGMIKAWKEVIKATEKGE